MHSNTSLARLLCSVIVLLALWMLPSTANAANAGKTNVLPEQHSNGEQGQLILAQVVFRHGARTPLQNTYWPDTQWTSCPDNFPSSLNFVLYDPTDSQITPKITDMTTPELPGGCRMGRLTSNGYAMAVKLGQLLRHHYVDRHKLIPGSYRADIILAHSTASQRTVNTLLGVLSGLFPDAAAAAATATEIRVSVRNESQEVMYGSGVTCPLLPNITAAVRQKQQQKQADDPHIQQLIPKIKSALNLPSDTPLDWSPLRDMILCMLADNKTLPVSSAAAKRYITVIDQIATQIMYQVRASGPDNCLVSMNACKDIVRLSVGMLLKEITDNMGDAAAAAAARPASAAAAAAAPAAAGAHSADLIETRYAASTEIIKGKTKLLHLQQQQYDGVQHNYKQQQQQQQAMTAAPKADSRRLKHAKVTVPSGTSSSMPSGSSSSSMLGGSSSSLLSGGSSSSSMPRLVLYSGHDTTVAPLLTALAQSHQPWPKFTSSLAIELWKIPSSSSSSSSSSTTDSSGGSDRFEVRVFHDGQPLKLNLSRKASSRLVAGALNSAFLTEPEHTTGSSDPSSSSSDLEIASGLGVIKGFGLEESIGGISLEEFRQLVGEYVIERIEHDQVCGVRRSLEVS